MQVDLSQTSGPPITTSQLAIVTGLSAQFIRMEIVAGELKAVRIGRARRKEYRIPWREARRYARALGAV